MNLFYFFYQNGAQAHLKNGTTLYYLEQKEHLHWNIEQLANEQETGTHVTCTSKKGTTLLDLEQHFTGWCICIEISNKQVHMSWCHMHI